MIEKKCSKAATHKPHLWSRTTRKTVTEETAGDTFSCPGKAVLGPKPQETDGGAQIAADARSGTNWALEVGYGPACVCGAFKEDSTVTHNGYTVLKTICHRHGIARGSQI